MKHMVQKIIIKYEIVSELIKRKELHLRALSKLINIPHPTVYRETKKLKEDNILEYEMKGRNKMISLKKGIESLYAIYQTEYYKTLKFIEKNPEFSILIEEIIKKTNSNLIILFGSYAKGIAKKDSDIDLFVETKNKKIKEMLENTNSRLSVKIGRLDNKTYLGKEIIDNHIIIKGVETYYEKNPIFN